MAKREMRISVTFEDPNEEDVLPRVLRRLLIDRLRSQRKQRPSGKGGAG